MWESERETQYVVRVNWTPCVLDSKLNYPKERDRVFYGWEGDGVVLVEGL